MRVKKKEKKSYDPMRDAESMMKVQSQGGKFNFGTGQRSQTKQIKCRKTGSKRLKF